jgi:hypothetical protein
MSDGGMKISPAMDYNGEKEEKKTKKREER